MNQKIFKSVAVRVVVAILLASALLFTGGTRNVAANPPTLDGGHFEDADGNLDPNNATPTAFPFDWNHPLDPITCPSSAGSGVNCGVDLVKSGSDNALGQGSKEDNPCPTVVSGQIPPSKDDLSRFYINIESVKVNNVNKLFVYLAWERSNLLGSAHMDFELNQDRTIPAGCSTPGRTPGDILIDFDFGGSGIPGLALHRWITTGTASTDCEASNTLPCWNKGVDLTGTEAEAQVNNAPVTDSVGPGASFTLAGNTKNGINSTFGEVGVDLSDAGIFSSSVCTHFGDAYLKSRSSGNSFTSELKDFIAPVPINISNCGNIIIRKVTDPSPDPTSSSFSYSTTGGLTPASFSLSDGGKQDYGNTVFAGDYSVTEADPGPDFTLEKLDCSASSTLNGSVVTTDLSTAKVTISLAADDVVDCTYTNKLQEGAIQVTKTSTKGTTLAGATFSVSGPSGDFTLTSGSDGTACVDHLVFGSYSVSETAAPTGYQINDTSTHTVTVDTNATCGSGDEVALAFDDTPLTDLKVTVHSEAVGGTSSTISCVDSSNTKIAPDQSGSDPSLSATGLVPDTYICTVVIDP